VISASSLFSVTDAENDVLTYFLYDGTAGGGHFVVNGTAIADQTVVALSASQLAQTTFVAGGLGTSDALGVMAYDGHTYSGNTSFSQFQVIASSSNALLTSSPSAQDTNDPFALQADHHVDALLGVNAMKDYFLF